MKLIEGMKVSCSFLPATSILFLFIIFTCLHVGSFPYYFKKISTVITENREISCSFIKSFSTDLENKDMLNSQSKLRKELFL